MTAVASTADKAAVEAFIWQCAQSAADLALYYVGVPDDVMMTELRNVESNLATDLTTQFSAETAAEIAARFVTAVINGRRELGSGGRA
jgi:hypothetical protein